MGFLILILLIGISLALLWWLGVRGGMLTASAAALLLGASGYALQGRPYERGAPAAGGEAHDDFPLTDARHAFFGNFTPAESWLRISEALARDGKSEEAVGILQNAVSRYPGASQMAPGHPGAPFFYGLALARSGDRPGALALWQQILKTAPKDAGWRPLVEQGVKALGGQPSAPIGQAATGS